MYFRYHPKIRWSQDELYVLLAIQIGGCDKNDMSIHVDDMSIKFQ